MSLKPNTINQWPRQAKRCLQTCAKGTDSDSSRVYAKSYSGICSPSIPSVVSNVSVIGQRRPWSDCADAQADLGLRCPHLAEDVFAWLGPYNCLIMKNKYRQESSVSWSFMYKKDGILHLPLREGYVLCTLKQERKYLTLCVENVGTPYCLCSWV